MTLIIFLYAVLASTFSAGKILLHYTTPIFLAGARMSIAGIILLAYQYFAPHEEFKFKKKHFKHYIQIIFFGIYLAYTLRFWALTYLPSFKACFLYNISPLFSVLYSYIFFKEKITLNQWIGLAIGFVGFIPILLGSSPEEATWGELFYISWPELAIIISAASQSYGWIIIRKLIRQKSYSPMMINGITMSIGGLLALITAWYYEGFFPVTAILPFSTWLAFVVIVSNILCSSLYGFLLKKYTATFLSFAGFSSPLFAALFGWAFLHETITWHFYLSSIIVFLGLILFYRDEIKENLPIDNI